MVVSQRFVAKLGACTYQGKNLSFKFSNGNASTSATMVDLQLEKNGYSAYLRCYLLNIESDIILGLPWLMSIIVTHQNTARGEFRFRCELDKSEHEWLIEGMVAGSDRTWNRICKIEGDKGVDEKMRVREAKWLISKYAIVIAEPKKPPPICPEDHAINFKQGAQ